MTNKTKLVTFTVTAAHRARLLAPFPASNSQGRERYMTLIPADVFPEASSRERPPLGMVSAASTLTPPIMVLGEDDLPLDRDYWRVVIDEAHRWRYPLNKLLVGRTISLAVESFVLNNQFVKDKVSIHLIAVKIHADDQGFGTDKGLEEHIKNIKAMLNHD